MTSSFHETSIFDPVALARLENLTLRARTILGSLAVGEHSSKMRGFSAEFSDHRPWEMGDDPKFMDWRVYARTGKRFLKRFTEDANQTYYFLLDHSPSMMRGREISDAGDSEQKKQLTKSEYAQCLGAMLGFLATRQKDRLGVSVFSPDGVLQKEPGTGEGHLFKCLEVLENAAKFPSSGGMPEGRGGRNHPVAASHHPVGCAATPPEEGNFGVKAFLEKSVGSFTRRGVIFLASDFFDIRAFSEILPILRLIRSERYEMALFHTLSPDEMTFPFTSATRFVSLETPGVSLTSRDASALRAAYLERFTRWRDEIRQGCERLGIFYQLTVTDRPLDEPLAEFLRRF